MAWYVNGHNLKMSEDDFGVALHFNFTGTTLGQYDKFKFIFKTEKNGDTLLEKVIVGSTNNGVDLVLTESDSEKLPVGTYVYSLQWFQDGLFKDTIIECATFAVGDVA